MRYASIDIGTNTILMLVAEVENGLDYHNGLPHVNRLADFYEVPRVGKNVSSSGMLSMEAMERGIEVLAKYISIAREYGVEKIVASATSAVRDAANREYFIEAAKSKFGIDIEVITGETEARLGYLAAVSGAPHPDAPTFVIDIGGGSTELSYGTGTKPGILMSIDVGAVRVTEKFFGAHNPPSDYESRERHGVREQILEGLPVP